MNTDKRCGHVQRREIIHTHSVSFSAADPLPANLLRPRSGTPVSLSGLDDMTASISLRGNMN
jgi:hypothetical protein